MRQACASCDYEGAPVKSYPHDSTSAPLHEGEKTFWLCALCANSRAGTMFQYRNAELALFAHVCFVGNCILWGMPK